MAQRYDVSLKSLFLKEGDGIIRRMLFGSKVVEQLSTEQPQIFNHRADLVARTEDNAVHHVEFQTHNEAAFALRMLGYYAYLSRAHNQHIHQVVLYLGKENLRIEAELHSPSVHFRFELIHLRELDAALLAASDDWADNVLALLAKGDPLKALETILPRLQMLQGEEQNWASSTLVLLSGIINLEETVNERLQELGMINIMENKVLGPMILEKIEKGRQEGLAFGQLQLLQEQLVEKFGLLPQWASERLQRASTEELHGWAKRILRSNTLEETLS